jgi:hypothetical protein
MATSRKSLQDLQQQEAALQQALAKKKAALAVRQAALRVVEQKAVKHKRFVVGKLVLDHPALAALTLDALQNVLTALARCVADPAQYRTFLEAHREPSAPEFERCSLPCFSDEKLPNGTQR